MKRSGLFFLMTLTVVAGCSRSQTRTGMVPEPSVESYGPGSDVGSAGDNQRPEHGAAWFMGGLDKEVRVCWRLAPDFGASRDEVISAFETAAATWKNYLFERMGWLLLGLPPSSQFSVNLKLIPQCDGSEHLTIYFGEETDETRAYRRQFDNPTAFVQRTWYSREKLWSKGFIWIAKAFSIDPGNRFPDWKRSSVLLGTLLHDLGHLFGNDHVPGTILDRRINAMLQFGDPGVISRIDVSRELLPDRAGKYEIHGRMYSYFGSDSEEVFEALTGRVPQGQMWIDIHRHSGGSRFRTPDLGYELPVHEITLSDETGRTAVPRDVTGAQVTFSPTGEGLFKIAGKRSEYLASDRAPTYYETIFTRSGEPIALVIEYRSSDMTDSRQVRDPSDLASIVVSVIYRGARHQIARTLLYP